MPQKPVFSRPPILTIPHCFNTNGTIRSTDERITRLYQRAVHWIDRPCLWEGLFRIACLIKSKPADEPVAALIRDRIRVIGNGAFDGTITEQISIARAAFALYEYNTDRNILKRISLWLRYLEVDFDALCIQDHLLFRPADLMELLVKFYQVTGAKAVLRLCSRLRAMSFDWMTTLHTYQQSIPIRPDDKNHYQLNLTDRPETLDYEEKQKLINHSEMIADGIRYTLFAGLFSGHVRDLSSGKTIWEYLKKHHRAICGGTSSNPFLCGCGSDQPVDTLATAAWTEAFASQMILPDSDWALDELIRIVFNSLNDCIEKDELPGRQYVNCVEAPENKTHDPAALYARVTRAAAIAYRNAVTIMQDGIRINYLLPARFLLMIRKQAIMLQMKERSVIFQCCNPFFSGIDVFLPQISGDSIQMSRAGKNTTRQRMKSDSDAGFFLHSEGEWQNGDGFSIIPGRSPVCEKTHHQGLCFFEGNHLLSICANSDQYAFAANESSINTEEKISILLKKVKGWKNRAGIPSDIPVMPETANETITAEMRLYHKTTNRITMFPRTGASCLK